MRQIKFRSWVKSREIMLPDENIYKIQDDWNVDILSENGDTICSLDSDEFELMQFTELKDRNGVEIFEGDIVRCVYFKQVLGANLGVTEVDAELIGMIYFNGLSLSVKNISCGKWCDYTGYKDGEGECEYAMLHDVYEGSQDAEMGIEVIGNIYENPDLL